MTNQIASTNGEQRLGHDNSIASFGQRYRIRLRSMVVLAITGLLSALVTQAAEIVTAWGDHSSNINNSSGIALSSNTLRVVAGLDPTDEQNIHALFSALKSRAEAHDVNGFIALFSTNYMHLGSDRTALRQDLQEGLSAVQSFSVNIDRIEGTGSNATVHGTINIVFNDGEPPMSWIEPDSEDYGLGMGWVRKEATGWVVIGNQERASVRVATEHGISPSGDVYLIRLSADSPLAIASVTVTGPNNTKIALQPNPGWGGFTAFDMPRAILPIGSAYSFDIQFADGPHQVLQDTVKSWVPVGPSVSVTTTVVTATIYWSDVAASVPNAAYYWVWVEGDGVSWYSEELPLSRTSIPFNEDGGATSSLKNGSNYTASVFIFDSR